jgi:hypothetical protein
MRMVLVAEEVERTRSEHGGWSAEHPVVYALADAFWRHGVANVSPCCGAFCAPTAGRDTIRITGTEPAGKWETRLDLSAASMNLLHTPVRDVRLRLVSGRATFPRAPWSEGTDEPITTGEIDD